MLTPSLISTFPGSQLVSVSQLMQPEIHWLRHAKCLSGRAVPLQDGLRRLSDWWQLRMVTVCHGIGIWRKTVKHHDNYISICQACYIGPANPKNWKECPGRFLGAESARSRIERRAGRRCGRISCCSGGCWQRIAHVVTKQPLGDAFSMIQRCFFVCLRIIKPVSMDFIWISYGFHRSCNSMISMIYTIL